MTGIELLLASATEYLCGMLVLAAFFSQRDNHPWLAWSVRLLCGAFHICVSMLTNDWPLALRMILILIDWFAVCEVCYLGNRWKKILIILLFWGVDYAIDISVLSICIAVTGGSAKTAVSPNGSYLISMISARSLLLSVSFACVRIVRKQERKYQTSGMTWVCLLFIQLYTIVGVGVLIRNAMQSDVLSGSIIAFSGGLLCVNVILCLAVNKLEQNRQIEQEKQRFQAEVTHSLELANTYRDSFNQQRKVTHEFRNQLDAVGNLLSQGEYDRAIQYVKHLQCSSQDIVPLISTNHPMVDAIFNQKYQQANEREVGILYDCNDLAQIPMEDGDLVTLLGNILDNAISASAQTSEKRVWVRLWQEQGVYQLVVRNSCLEDPPAYPAQECILHGFGMGLVKAVLEKYAYPYYWEQCTAVFAFSAILG